MKVFINIFNITNSKKINKRKGYSDINDLPENWESYKYQKEFSKDGAPTENVIKIIQAAKGRDLVIADKKLKQSAAELLEKGLEPKAQAPDTISVAEMEKMIKVEELVHECN
ncbi:MAG: hypothetical protein ACI37T_06250 [Candidatus Gastranaerophilaceae bacterium]